MSVEGHKRKSRRTGAAPALYGDGQHCRGAHLINSQPPHKGGIKKSLTYNKLDKGGHFAAWEQPALFTEEIRTAFRPLRKSI
jgi:hypothetical protein